MITLYSDNTYYKNMRIQSGIIANKYQYSAIISFVPITNLRKKIPLEYYPVKYS